MEKRRTCEGSEKITMIKVEYALRYDPLTKTDRAFCNECEKWVQGKIFKHGFSRRINALQKDRKPRMRYLTHDPIDPWRKIK